MRLTKLKLAGFKSFVDPTVLLTPGQLVGIVGPNGCGKSNVIDAVRWVLGESRASALRGESMQDVIFNGSTTRKPVSRASVELVFDNGDGRAAGQWSQYAEIAVKRVVDRSGESDYFINNVKVRRKDVIDLLLGTGLGPRAYAIIEQGMISRVIEARPEDVRAFLEEAAGITKYKERRRETQGRLSDARDNLARIEDIRAELGHQIDKLGAQAEVAQRYQSLNEMLSARQVLLWVFKREQAHAEREKAATGIAQTSAELERETARLRTLEAQVAASRETHARVSDAVGVAQGDLYAITTEVSRVENELKTLRDTRIRLTQRIEQLTASEAQWRERVVQLAQEQERWETLREAAAQRQRTSAQTHDAAQQKLPEFDATHRTSQSQLETLRREHALAEQQARVEETRRQSSQRALEGLAQRRQRLEQERAQQQPQAFGELPNLEAAAEQAHKRFSLAQDSLATRQTVLEQAQTAVSAARQAEQSATRQATEKRARLEALRALQTSLRDQGDLGAWLRTAGLADCAPLWQSLHVEAGWEVAMEALLRERIAALGPVAGGMPSGLFVQPVPATVVVLRACDRVPQESLRFDGEPLLGKVRCDNAEIQRTLAAWLSGVYAVDALDGWLDGNTPLAEGIVLVSRTGAVLTARELALFAPDARTHGVMERQREIETLAHELIGLDTAQGERNRDVEAAEFALKRAQDELAEVRRQQAELQQQRHAAQLEVVRVQQIKSRYDERVTQLAREADELVRAESTERTHMLKAEQEREQHQSQASTLAAQLASKQQALAEHEQALRTQRDQVQNLLRARQEAEFSARECVSKLEDIARNQALANEQMARGEVELVHLLAERDGLDETSLQTSLQTALDLRHSREATLAARRDAQEAAAQSMRQLDEERLRCERALDPLRERVNNLRLLHQAAELAHQQAMERLGEMQAHDKRLAAEELAEVREMALSREVARLSREIAELGAVNLVALSELKTASERKQFLDAQNDDLTSAIDTLEDAIRRIDRETRDQLQGTYNTVNRHFGELFPQLFGGGEAALVLTGEEILDAGVQIVAQPPGKKNASIHLLSGGEKALTAIALVFAMFRLNPAPFCMLDEVDAPLDDSNTERYCTMVKSMSAVTQFVFISHSKITMEMAQQLIGVTMQEQGVSRVVEVDMDEALRLAQPAAQSPGLPAAQPVAI